MDSLEIQAAVQKLNTKQALDEEEAWAELRTLGIEVVPYLLRAYPSFGKWQGRVSLVYHSVKFARISEEAFQLGIQALEDRATLVRYRACSLLAYSLRRDAINPLKPLLDHSDSKTAQDARAAIAAIRRQNHHFFIDRTRSGNTFWQVNDDDAPTRIGFQDRLFDLFAANTVKN